MVVWNHFSMIYIGINLDLKCFSNLFAVQEEVYIAANISHRLLRIKNVEYSATLSPKTGEKFQRSVHAYGFNENCQEE